MLDRSLIPYRLTAFSLATRRTSLTNDKLLDKTAQKKNEALFRAVPPHALDLTLELVHPERSNYVGHLSGNLVNLAVDLHYRGLLLFDSIFD